MSAKPECYGTITNGDPTSGLVCGKTCRRAIEDLPECMANHYTVEAIQLDEGDFHCHSEFVAAPGAALSLEHIARQVHLTGTMKDDWLGLGIPVRTQGSLFLGEQTNDSRVPLTLCCSKFEWLIRPGFQLLVVLADRQRVFELAQRSNVSPQTLRAFGPGAQTSGLRTDPGVVAEARRSLLGLLEAAKRGELDGSASKFENAVLEVMISVLDSSHGELLGIMPSVSLVRRAKEIVGPAPKKFRIAALCDALHVGPRTLGKAFTAVTGVGPHAYFLRQRLNAARAELLRANPLRDTVTNIALELGFTELGRFAVRYRALFGESPSQTLRRQMSNVAPVPARLDLVASH